MLCSKQAVLSANSALLSSLSAATWWGGVPLSCTGLGLELFVILPFHDNLLIVYTLCQDLAQVPFNPHVSLSIDFTSVGTALTQCNK